EPLYSTIKGTFSRRLRIAPAVEPSDRRSYTTPLSAIPLDAARPKRKRFSSGGSANPRGGKSVSTRTSSRRPGVSEYVETVVRIPSPAMALATPTVCDTAPPAERPSQGLELSSRRPRPRSGRAVERGVRSSLRAVRSFAASAATPLHDARATLATATRALGRVVRRGGRPGVAI